jgi:putative oxidoreductase
MFTLLYLFSDLAILILRLALGAIFIAHGWPKIKGLKTTAANFSAMGFKPGVFWGTVVAFLEFFGGILLILGLYLQVVAALFALELLAVLVWKVAKKQPFFGNIEFDLLIFATVLALLTLGPGTFSASKYFLGGF